MGGPYEKRSSLDSVNLSHGDITGFGILWYINFNPDINFDINSFAHLFVGTSTDDKSNFNIGADDNINYFLEVFAASGYSCQPYTFTIGLTGSGPQAGACSF